MTDQTPEQQPPDLDVHPAAAAMNDVTVALVAAIDLFWEHQPDFVAAFDQWRTGRASLLVRATPRGVEVEAVSITAADVRDAPDAPGTGQYL